MGKVNALLYIWAQCLINGLLGIGNGLALTSPEKTKRLVL